MASRAIKIDPKKTSSSEPKPQAESPSRKEPESANGNAIEVRAYELWIQRGCPIGSPEVDWLQAEEELRGNAA